MKTDYSSAMEEVKHQREMIVRQQITQQQLKEGSVTPITPRPIIETREGNKNEVRNKHCHPDIKDIAFGAEGLGLITGPVKSGSVANLSPPPRRFCVAQAVSREDGFLHLLRTST